MDENKELKDKIKFKIAMSEIYNEEKSDMVKNKSSVIGKIAIAACFTILLSGIKFSDEISAKVIDIYKFREPETIEIKLPEEILNDAERTEEVLKDRSSIIPWDETTSEVLETDAIDFKINSVAMNDYYMILDTDIKFLEEVTNKMPFEEIYNVRIIDLTIKDENGKVLFCIEENKLKEIFETDNLDSIKNNPKYCMSNIVHWSYKGKVDKTNQFEIILNTKLPSIYPKSKKLTIEFSKIALDKSEASIGIGTKHHLHQDQSLTLLGDWSYEIDVPKIYSEREEHIQYKLSSDSPKQRSQLFSCYYEDGFLKAEVALESENRMNGPWASVKIGDMLSELDVEPIISQYITYKISSSDELKKIEKWESEPNIVEDFYLKTSNGFRTWEPGVVKIEDGKMIRMDKTSWHGAIKITDGPIWYSNLPTVTENGEISDMSSVRFDIPEEELTDKMTIHFDYLGREIEFKIERVKEGE